MQQLLRGAFVTSEDLVLEPDGSGGYFIEGCIHCLGGIYIDVSKHVAKIGGEGGDPLVQTIGYRYNVALRGRGNIFRYDCPHRDHNQDHHLHQYDVLNGDQDGTLEFIYSEDDVPTLQEVILKAEDWYHANHERL
jgi:hypothetical protein